MNQATATTTADTLPVDLEVLRLRLEEDGKFYWGNRDSEEAQQRLLHTLKTNDCREIITAVVEGDDLANVFVSAGAQCHVDILEEFINHRMNVDVKDKNGWTALLYASCNGHEECVRFLLNRHAKLDAQTKIGLTALIYASMCGFIKIVEILLEKNANFDLQDKFRKSALMYACERNHKEIVEVLLNHGVDVELKSNEGNTALDFAENEEIKELIRNHVNTSFVLK